MKKSILILLGILAAFWSLNLDKALLVEPGKEVTHSFRLVDKRLLKDSAFSVDFTNHPEMVSLERIAKDREKLSKVQDAPKERLMRVLSD